MPATHSTSAAEIRAVFRKEAMSELRGRSGLFTAGLFGLVATVIIGFAGASETISGTLGAALLWVVLLFAGVVALPRAFLAEEEQGTADLLRLVAKPEAVFWGKALFNLVQMTVFAGVLTPILLALLRLSSTQPLLLILTIVAGVVALAGTVTLVGALVAQASNRAALAGAVALPLLVPLVILGVASTKVALGAGFAALGLQAFMGLACYAVAAFAVGPLLFASVWKS